MPAREQRHAARSRFRLLGWIPEVLIVLIVLVSGLQVQFDLGQRWLGLEHADPALDPAQVPAPAGLGLAAGATEPALAPALVPGTVDAASVRKALKPLLSDPKLGNHVSFQVVDLTNGESVFQRDGGAVVPASTMKLLTAAAALSTLGADTHFATRVLGAGNRLVLVGGGDPFLASTAAKAKGQYPDRANLTTLARRTAAALKQQAITSVRLDYDASMFTGPAINPRWPSTYVPENVVPPISALWVDEAIDSNGRYVADPAGMAADRFAAALRDQGITVSGPQKQRKAPATATELASVSSASVGEIVEQTLAVSDNNAAEVLARHVGAATNGSASFIGGLSGIFAVLARLGVDVADSTAYDGSGLSRENELTTATLLGVLEAAASPANPELRQVITGLPVAGFTGSLARRFDQGPATAQGRVRAKTGTLTGVHGLAGIATDLDGNLMAFAFVADQVAAADGTAAQHALDLMAAALGSCRCGG